MLQSAAQRQHMIDSQLTTNDVLDPRLLRALADTPREPFLPEALRGAAYTDEDLEIAPGRYLLAPLTLARLLELANITLSSRVLMIGCLTGYAAAIAARLAGNVTATESDAGALEEAARQMKRLLLSNVDLKPVASLADGYKAGAPYDAIIIAGAVGFIPNPLALQLAHGGRLATVRHTVSRPDIQGGLGKGLVAVRIGDTLQYREHFDTGAALLAGFEPPSGFTFF